MIISRQEGILTEHAGRSNQKNRTRRALLDAAMDLVRAGRPPSIADAAELALVSPATAYRYFSTASALWEEAALELVEPWGTDLVDAAGDDLVARLEAVVTSIGWHQFGEETIYRRLALGGLERWLEHAQTDDHEPIPVREGRRQRWNDKIVEPLRGNWPDPLIEDLKSALALVWGTEALITLLDVARLDPDNAKRVMLTAAKWMLNGAIADAKSKGVTQ